MPKCTIDGIEIEVEPGTTVLQAAERLGIEIPRFCYHERLAIAGNCRMCLVEVSPGPPKPAASCALPVGDGMTIKTDSPMVVKARRAVMEFLLINHPLDCPICDQGGECDLQDQAMAYGRDRSRFGEMKRAVPDKDMGPLVGTHMTRCIQCTRCIRFITDIAGVPELGATGRGEGMEITTYVEKALTSELSGNIIDLCPVGALTNKPYAFKARPWELHHTESIDVLDAVGSNVFLDTRGNEVLRAMPRLNEGINEEWLADKSRFAVDGLSRRRLDRPWVRRDGKLIEASWSEALAAVAEAAKGLKGEQMAALAGDQADCEAMFALKSLFQSLGSPHLDCRQDGAALDPTCRAGYLFNTTIAGIEQADAILLIGTDPRREAPILNARIGKRWRAGGCPIGVIGPQTELTYKVRHLGSGPADLADLAAGKGDFLKVLKDAERPMIVLGMGALARPDGAAILAQARALAEAVGAAGGNWAGFNVLHTAAARVGGLDLGFVPGAGGRDLAGIVKGAGEGAIKLLYLLGADEIDMDALGKAFVVYQGHHGDAGARRADVILPGAAYSEKPATYVNTEGRVQRTRRAAHPPGQGREDWAILRALSEHLLPAPLPFDSLAELRRAMVAEVPHLAREDHIEPAVWGTFGQPGETGGEPFMSPVKTYYTTCPISRASPTMAACVAEILGQGTASQEERTGTDG
ncbi:NADH-quinone oxidoreductase subunit NuoG [Roseospirillum parvum]|uniref:NADH-quinone oxidoreductase n=1 Tax=Roseospirillum parvum TaxID=83401 RepID=A0A1G8B4K9_9PROT|nr:NADH-quinone oxidoreductase subunit NuoG [Roseospirillum parvum]SDH28098.1 NADH-quinone oxidoreductase subunit G [Roseospirillum parvum]